jgi:hypothetical protein
MLSLNKAIQKVHHLKPIIVTIDSTEDQPQ